MAGKRIGNKHGGNEATQGCQGCRSKKINPNNEGLTSEILKTEGV
jgi:hypothetical protein